MTSPQSSARSECSSGGDEQTKLGAGAPFSVVGVPGSPAGSAYTNVERGAPAGNLSGYLQVNLANPATTQYGFVFDEYVPFSTHLDDGTANVVTVGGSRYESTAMFGAQSGFHVVVLDGTTLALKANRTFVTSTAFGTHDQENQQAMATFLSQVDPGSVVVVQTIAPDFDIGPGPTDA